MRDELIHKIMNLLISYGIEPEELRSKLYITFEPYEITARTTEVAVMNEEPIEKYIKMFLLNKRVAGRTERTLHLYNSALRLFFNECKKSPLEVTADDIKLFLAVKEVRDHVSKTYLKDLRRDISTFYTWMVKEEHVLKNPMNKVDDIKVPKVKKHAFTELQIEQLRLAIPDDNTRMKFLIELLLSTWCRISEVVGMKISDISENMESVTVHGKGQKDRICYLNAKAKLYLKKYLSERKDDNEWLFAACICNVNTDYTFSHKMKGSKAYMWWTCPEMVSKEKHADKGSIETNIRKLGNKAGVEGTHPHRFRRTGATLALRRGMPIEQVSKLLGHESIETTQIYLDISEKEIEQGHKKYVV